jgi:hypothetical protein
MAKRKSQTEPDLERVAAEVWLAYQSNILRTRTRRSSTSIKRAGCELAVIICYLEGMIDREIVEWLKENKDLTISISAVGRMCAELFRLGATRFGVLKARAGGGGDSENGSDKLKGVQK